MAANRANLVPRLAISTILNEHINEALGDYRTNNHSPDLLHQSIVESEEETPRVLNFKKAMSKGEKKNGQATVRSNLPKKSEENKKLLMGFFDENWFFSLSHRSGDIRDLIHGIL